MDTSPLKIKKLRLVSDVLFLDLSFLLTALIVIIYLIIYLRYLRYH